MTDKDIIKALEWLEEIKGFCSSEEKYIYATTLVDLINSQQEEIERLEIELDAMRGAANSYKFHYNEAKTEAIKEFAERLKKAFIKCDPMFNRHIDNLVKEMVGDNNA